MDFRISYGEMITGSSWLMRDLWQTTNMNYGARWGLATNPKRFKSSGFKRLLERAIWEQGIRRTLTEGQKRHEWKAAHGFRKFYKSRAEQIMRSINVELTMGHDIGVASSYYKPTELEVLEDYLKAIKAGDFNYERMVLAASNTFVEDEISTCPKHLSLGKIWNKRKQTSAICEICGTTLCDDHIFKIGHSYYCEEHRPYWIMFH